MKSYFNLAIHAAIGIICIIGFAGKSTANESNPILHIGIVQRFGSNSKDRLKLKVPNGDKLTLTFPSEDGKMRQTLTTDNVVIEISQQPLTQPILDEKIILSHHRSFENAAASAYRFNQEGVETEIAQPRRWQVWAKRSTYTTPLLRRMLLYSLKLHGYNIVQLDSQVVKQQPKVAWLLGSTRYEKDLVDITSDRGIVEVNDRPYAGTFRLQPNAHRSFTLVNYVPLETYLRGVVPHEIGYNAPYAAVQAQAVLARTYALASRHRFLTDNYELCATTQCQVYRGLENTTTTADNAIADTSGKVLTYNNKVVDALYSSTTGGVTANYNDIWDGQERPYLRSVVDSVTTAIDLKRSDLADENRFRAFIERRDGFNEVGWNNFRWKSDSTLDEIKKTLQEFLKLSGDTDTKFQQIKQVSITKRAPSGRVLAMEVVTDTKTITLEKDEIVDAFEAPNSTLFYMQPIFAEESKPAEKQNATDKQNSQSTQNKQNDSTKILQGYSFVGGGLGHGVGMSQTGSYNLARLGWSYDRILDFYFAGTKLQTLRSEFLPDTSQTLPQKPETFSRDRTATPRQ
ncbi:SpoIID/LytB domain-containing protein [Pseudanabaena sp. PCC 6802]|uniref:SpoIID/LytB domain-containing protein n=1 Tax=Pseudanabaena sp. PCC 6802 TaxID=118173 RepID=UPI00034BAF44|nr:SpoIID/LytB domain-containing protein [Pseudanabaena sp. PCC 6802]